MTIINPMTIVLAQQPDPAAVRRTTEEVLSQADYAVPGGPSLLDRGLGFLLEQLGRVLLQFDRGEGGGSTVAAVVLVLVVLAVLVAVALFVARLRRSRVVDPVVEGPVGRSPVDWAAEAARHEAAGDLREALRCRYREVLAHLAAEGLVEEIPGRTTGEYAAAVRIALPHAASAFDRLTRRFEDTWYGGKAVDDTVAAEVAQARADVRRAVPGRRAGRGAGR